MWAFVNELRTYRYSYWLRYWTVHMEYFLVYEATIVWDTRQRAIPFMSYFSFDTLQNFTLFIWMSTECCRAVNVCPFVTKKSQPVTIILRSGRLEIFLSLLSDSPEDIYIYSGYHHINVVLCLIVFPRTFLIYSYPALFRSCHLMYMYPQMKCCKLPDAHPIYAHDFAE